jgi:hypothetical protein
VGSLLWAGASALLCEDAFRSWNWSVTACLQPILTASAVARAAWVHPSEEVVKDIRRATRKRYSAEEKIRIALDGLRGERRPVPQT